MFVAIFNKTTRHQWRDSIVIPKNCKIFEFSKNLFVNLLSMQNESYRWNFGSLAYVRVDVFFEKHTQSCSWIILVKIKEIAKILFSVDSAWKYAQTFLKLSLKNVLYSTYRCLKSIDFEK